MCRYHRRRRLAGATQHERRRQVNAPTLIYVLQYHCLQYKFNNTHSQHTILQNDGSMRCFSHAMATTSSSACVRAYVRRKRWQAALSSGCFIRLEHAPLVFLSVQLYQERVVHNRHSSSFRRGNNKTAALYRYRHKQMSLSWRKKYK